MSAGTLTFGPPKVGWPAFSADLARHTEEGFARQRQAPEVEYRGTTYLSGPMRGYAQCNFPAFDEAQKVLEAEGWTVISPAEHDRRAHHFDAVGCKDCSNAELLLADFPLDGAILWDLEQIIKNVTAIHLLPGWRGSSGARLEHEAALFAHREIWYPTEDYGWRTTPPAWELTP